MRHPIGARAAESLERDHQHRCRRARPPGAGVGQLRRGMAGWGEGRGDGGRQVAAGWDMREAQIVTAMQDRFRGSVRWTAVRAKWQPR